MNGRLNASLDGAFKIFGRVVARQSLVQLNTSLSGLRDSFAAAVRTFSATPEVFDPIGKAEAAFAQSLQDNAKSLRRAAGDEWFAAMEKDFATLTGLRAEPGEDSSGFDDDRQQLRRANGEAVGAHAEGSADKEAGGERRAAIERRNKRRAVNHAAGTGHHRRC